EGREPGGHALLGPGHEPVAAEQHESADDEGRAPVLRLRTDGSAPARPGIEENARDRVPQPGEDKRRDRLDAEADREVGRAPENVDRREGETALAARSRARLGDLTHGASPAPSRSRDPPRPARRAPRLRRRAG